MCFSQCSNFPIFVSINVTPVIWPAGVTKSLPALKHWNAWVCINCTSGEVYEWSEKNSFLLQYFILEFTVHNLENNLISSLLLSTLSLFLFNFLSRLISTVIKHNLVPCSVERYEYGHNWGGAKVFKSTPTLLKFSQWKEFKDLRLIIT